MEEDEESGSAYESKGKHHGNIEVDEKMRLVVLTIKKARCRCGRLIAGITRVEVGDVVWARHRFVMC